MEITVIKSDGSEEEFNVSKIQQAIEGAAHDADVALDEIEDAIERVIEQITSELEDREEVASSEIRSWILSSLEGINTDIIDAWKEYDEERDKYPNADEE